MSVNFQSGFKPRKSSRNENMDSLTFLQTVNLYQINTNPIKYYKKMKMLYLCCTHEIKKGSNISVEAFTVLEAGIEPAHPKILDFESSASTNSATRACESAKLENKILSSLKINRKIFSTPKKVINLQPILKQRSPNLQIISYLCPM